MSKFETPDDGSNVSSATASYHDLMFHDVSSLLHGIPIVPTVVIALLVVHQAGIAIPPWETLKRHRFLLLVVPTSIIDQARSPIVLREVSEGKAALCAVLIFCVLVLLASKKLLTKFSVANNTLIPPPALLFGIDRGEGQLLLLIPWSSPDS